MKLPCFYWLPTYVWRGSGTSQSFTDQFVLGRCFQHSSTSWTGHTTFLIFAVGELLFQTKRNLFFPLLVCGCVLAPLHCSLLEKKKYLAKENDAKHLVFTFRLMKECGLVPRKVTEIQLSCLHPCHSPCWQRQIRRGNSVLKPSNP